MDIVLLNTPSTAKIIFGIIVMVLLVIGGCALIFAVALCKAASKPIPPCPKLTLPSTTQARSGSSDGQGEGRAD